MNTNGFPFQVFLKQKGFPCKVSQSSTPNMTQIDMPTIVTSVMQVYPIFLQHSTRVLYFLPTTDLRSKQVFLIGIPVCKNVQLIITWLNAKSWQCCHTHIIPHKASFAHFPCTNQLSGFSIFTYKINFYTTKTCSIERLCQISLLYHVSSSYDTTRLSACNKHSVMCCWTLTRAHTNGARYPSNC